VLCPATKAGNEHEFLQTAKALSKVYDQSGGTSPHHEMATTWLVRLTAIPNLSRRAQKKLDCLLNKILSSIFRETRETREGEELEKQWKHLEQELGGKTQRGLVLFYNFVTHILMRGCDASTDVRIFFAIFARSLSVFNLLVPNFSSTSGYKKEKKNHQTL
jgi:hypothetical protein